MSLQFIIDGNNVINHRAFAAVRTSGDSRQALLDFIERDRPCGSLKNRVTVVFDGYPGGFSGRDSAIDVMFSCDTSADLRIKRLLEGRGENKNIIVVSDDNEVLDFARTSGAQILKVEAFVFAKKKRTSVHQDDSAKPEITHAAMLKINQELRDRWLKK